VGKNCTHTKHWIRATRTTIYYRTTIYSDPTPTYTDMEFRDSFSRLKKKVKYRITGRKPEPNKSGADVGGERVDSAGSRSGSVPHVVAGGSHDQEGEGSSEDGGRVLSTIRLPQPGEPGPVPEHGSVNDDERRGADVDGGEIEQTHSRLHLADAEVVEGSGPAEGKDVDGEKVEPVYPTPSTTSIPHDGKPDSM
jgi:hypothetical protein